MKEIDVLSTSTVALTAADIRRLTGQTHEECYIELVRLEAAGRARVESTGNQTECAWRATPGAAWKA